MMNFRHFLIESAYYHTSRKGLGKVIRKTGFLPSTTGELGPGVYLSVDRAVFPSHLRKHGGEAYEAETIPVQISPDLKLFPMDSDAPNPITFIFRAFFGKDYARIYDSMNDKRLLFLPNGGPNWSYLHGLLKDRGYGGIRRTPRAGDVGNTDVLIFDPADAIPK